MGLAEIFGLSILPAAVISIPRKVLPETETELSSIKAEYKRKS
jgi:hypothetical protein